MAKLTLSVDESVIAEAKAYAKKRETSLSEMVEGYLAAVVKSGSPEETPVLKRVRGVLKGRNREEYREYLHRKHLG
ncbi:MAG: hypothetical protein HY820_26160 [Acidobacteria bacterium]|nr:hypothetical protein [Acidobacteriota bacterium]